MNTENQNNETKNITGIYIKAFEKGEQVKSTNSTIYSAYKTSKETNNEMLNFYEIRVIAKRKNAHHEALNFRGC